MKRRTRFTVTVLSPDGEHEIIVEAKNAEAARRQIRKQVKDGLRPECHIIHTTMRDYEYFAVVKGFGQERRFYLWAGSDNHAKELALEKFGITVEVEKP